MSTAVRRATRSYRCRRCGYAKTYPNAGAVQARYWFDKHSCAKTERLMVAEHLAAIREAAIDRTPQPCLHKIAQHQHGTRACYVLDRCRCRPCSNANSAAENERERLKLYGRYAKYVDAYPVRLHILELVDYGIGLKQLVKVSGVSHGLVWKLMYGKTQPDGSRRPTRRVLRKTAEAIYAIEPDYRHLAGGACIDATGTRRRLQALVAIGYSQTFLATRLGMNVSNFGTMLERSQVQKRTVEAVRRLYDDLSMSPRVGHDQRTRISVSRARGYAAMRGWPPPLGWDDETIDDPTSTPHTGYGDPVRVDEVAVERVLAGDFSLARGLTSDERRAVTAVWRNQGRSLAELARATGWKVDRYLESGAA